MLKILSRPDARRLRDYFTEANYTRDAIRETLIVNELSARHLRNLPRLLDRTRERSALHTLMRWFAVGVPVETKAAQELIPDWVLGLFLESGLLYGESENLLSAVMLTPFEGLLIATDHSLKIEAGERSDTVLVVNPTTWLLHRFTIRRPSRATLDLGAGGGVLALAAAAHTERVVATDVNPRATEFALFNASLNGIDNVECLTGDLFEPVAGRTFDRIITNPPFFISPASRYMFCDNAMDLDLFCRNLVRAAPAYLNEGGYMQMVCEWAEVKGQPWQERIAEWVEASGCDAWIMKTYTAEPSKYAQDRIRETTPPAPEADSRNYAEWMAYYRERSLEAIHSGIIALRRRSGKNWVRLEEVAGTSKQPFGDDILRGFAARDFLEAHSADEQMLDVKLTVSPDAQLDQRIRHSDGKWRPVSLHLFKVTGVPYIQKLEPRVAEFVGRFDGTRTVGQTIQELAEKVDADPEQVRQECLAVVRKLIERGFLLC